MVHIDFIGLGAQKTGSSWLYSCISEHPEICSPLKDLHFFSRDRNWKKGVDWYNNIFKRCKKKFCIGEISTSYFYSEEAAIRIKKSVPHVNLLVVLRHPVERAISHYNNDVKAGRVSPNLPFSEALKLHPEYIENSLYKKHLTNYLKHFPIENIKIILYDDICNDPLEALKGVFRYLSVDTNFTPSFLTSRINTARVPRSFFIDRTLSKISRLISKAGFSRFIQYLRKIGAVDFLRDLNTSVDSEKRLESCRNYGKEIACMFESDIVWLENILNRDLSHWRAVK